MDSPLQNSNLQEVKIELTNTQVSQIISDYIENTWGFKVVQSPYIKENFQRHNRDSFVIHDDSCFSVVSMISVEKIEKEPTFGVCHRVLFDPEVHLKENLNPDKQ